MKHLRPVAPSLREMWGDSVAQGIGYLVFSEVNNSLVRVVALPYLELVNVSLDQLSDAERAQFVSSDCYAKLQPFSERWEASGFKKMYPSQLFMLWRMDGGKYLEENTIKGGASRSVTTVRAISKTYLNGDWLLDNPITEMELSLAQRYHSEFRLAWDDITIGEYVTAYQHNRMVYRNYDHMGVNACKQALDTWRPLVRNPDEALAWMLAFFRGGDKEPTANERELVANYDYSDIEGLLSIGLNTAQMLNALKHDIDPDILQQMR